MAKQMSEARAAEYWHRNILLMGQVLVIWLLVSFGCGIVFVDWLNKIHLGGYPLGFWFAQQGSIYVFVALIFYYRSRMTALDHEFQVEED